MCVCVQFYEFLHTCIHKGFHKGSVVKNLPASAGDVSLIAGLGWSPGEEDGNPLLESCLENPMNREPGKL